MHLWFVAGPIGDVSGLGCYVAGLKKNADLRQRRTQNGEKCRSSAEKSGPATDGVGPATAEGEEGREGGDTIFFRTFKG